MFAFSVKGFATTASFRIPENHTFQQTLPLPPVTALSGLMGAAMGLSFEAAMKYRENNSVLFGVTGFSLGEMRDLWKYNKIKTGESLKDVLIREYLADLNLNIIIGSENKSALSVVREGFLNPRYALTAGNSDDLLKLSIISDIGETREGTCRDFENTVLPGNKTIEYDSLIDLKNAPITYKVRAPQVFLLPSAFNFDDEERRVSKREQFTFVGSPIRLKNAIAVNKFADMSIVML